MFNDYDKYAAYRQEIINDGTMLAHQYVEKPMMESMLPDLSDKKILMLGCGTGDECKLLIEHGASSNNIIGIDISEASIEIAKKTYPDIEFIVDDINNLPFLGNYFDFVYSSLSVHYSETPEKVYSEVYRVLKREGEFLFSLGHPIRFASINKIIDNEEYRIIGCNKDTNELYGSYNSFKKHVETNFTGVDKKEILSFFVGSPSYHFKLLKQTGFEIIDFTESSAVEEVKEIDENYYLRNSEFPQFMAFLLKK